MHVLTNLESRVSWASVWEAVWLFFAVTSVSHSVA